MNERAILLIDNEKTQTINEQISKIVEFGFNKITVKIFSDKTGYQNIFTNEHSIINILNEYNHLNKSNSNITWAIDVPLEDWDLFIRERNKYDFNVMVDLILDMEKPIDLSLLIEALNYKNRIDVNVIYCNGLNEYNIKSNQMLLNNLIANKRNWDISFLGEITNKEITYLNDFIKIQKKLGLNNDYKIEEENLNTLINMHYNSKPLIFCIRTGKIIPFNYSIGRYSNYDDISFDNFNEALIWKNKKLPNEILRSLIKNNSCMNCNYNMNCIKLELYSKRKRTELLESKCRIKVLLADSSKNF